MPKRKVKSLEIFRIDATTKLPLPYADGGVRAGFPSPAQDYMSEALDLNIELIHDPTSTFYARVVGDSMSGEGIDEGDILVIDKSLEPLDGDLCVCFINGDFTLKRLRMKGDHAELVASNPKYKPIPVTADDNFMVWGVVTFTIKKNRRPRR
jgi:DNA polymerase V